MTQAPKRRPRNPALSSPKPLQNTVQATTIQKTHSPADPIQVFSWGYHGWGHCAHKFVEAAVEAEALRGYGPPIFVDVRMLRSGRATDFVGNHFKHISEERGCGYHWMEGLGNKAVADRKRGELTINRPETIQELLDLIIQKRANKRRVIFFCACEHPRIGGDYACHRTLVAEMLVQKAREQNIRLISQEWPGGDYQEFHFTTNPGNTGTSTRIPLHPGMTPAQALLIPQLSTAHLYLPDEDEPYRTVTAEPAKFFTNSADWRIPCHPDMGEDYCRQLRSREQCGYDPLVSWDQE